MAKQLIKRSHFYRRMTKFMSVFLMVILFGLLLGIFGYHYFAGLSWVDSLLNASMILTGMGPVDTLTNDTAKIFASFYALFSGIVFLSAIGLFISPIVHRILHNFHIEERE